MERYLLDASAILHIIGGTKPGHRIILFVKGAEQFTSIISYCEVLNTSELKKQEKAEEFIRSLAILPLTLADGYLTRDLQYACRKSGKQVATMDCLIAATALNNDLEVVTTDADFDRIEGIKKHVF